MSARESLVARCLVLLLLAGGGGCVRLAQPSPVIHDYDLTYASPVIQGEPLEVVLSLPTLGITATYDREAIVYRTAPNQIGKYFYHRWATNPADLVADALARDFSASHLYRAVTHQRSPLASNYQLSGEIEAIEERQLGDGCAAVLTIRFLLVRQAAVPRDSVLLRPRFDLTQPAPCNDPPQLVSVLGQLLARISVDLQQQVYDAIVHDLGARPPGAGLTPPGAAGS